jgi:hypothetical protein
LDKHQNDWAHREDGSRIHIVDVVETGRKGYYCPGIGCNAPMQAVKPKIKRPYFRHDAYNIDHKSTCTYSNETYRHKVAKEILQRLKELKVPAVKKFPPYGIDGAPNLLRKSLMVRAHRVEIELNFYEDENSEIKWGRSSETSEKNLLIRPDVVFFNIENRPILLIELVATHKIDSEKSAKLRRLGIDTIRVKIPKGNEAEIENTFKHTNRTLWEFNREEYETDYIHIPGRNQEELSETDIQQRELFEEAFGCRKADIGNLIRSINRCLESEQYQEIERGLRSDLYRAEDATRRARGEVQKLRFAIRADLERSVRDRRSEIEIGRKSLHEKSDNLERRYNIKRDQLTQDQRAFREASARITKEIEELGAIPETAEGRRRQIGQRREAIESRRGTIIDSTEREHLLHRKVREEKNIITDRIEAEGIRLQLKHDKIKAEERERFEGAKNDITVRIGELRANKEELWSEEKGGFESIYTEESELIRRALEYIQRGDIVKDIPFPERYHQLLSARGILNDIEKIHSRTKLIISATTSLEDKTYKDWYK